MMKKLISVVLIIVLLMSLMVFAPYAVQAKNNNNGANTASKLQLLNALGVVPSIPADKLGEGVSRADFAIYAGNLVNISSGRENTASYFKDISNDHWALDSINGLVKIGAITVGEEGLFYPNRDITLQEATKIMLSLTGFAPFAEAKGGYPSGYMQIAYERDITDGISQGGSFTMADAVNLLYNSANMTLLESYAIKGDGVKYATDTDTLLSVYHDVYKAEGVVTGVFGITLNDFSAPEEGQIRVGETLYKMGTKDMYSYLGMYVEFFYRENEASYDDIVNIRAIDYRNKFEDFSLDDFNGFNENDYTVSYTDNKNTTKSFKLSYGVCVVRNGKVMDDDIVNAFANTGKGSIRLIDTQRNGSYDVAIISEYNNMVVGHIDTENMIAYDKYDPSFNICLEKKQKKSSMLYNASGSAVKISALSIGSIVTVFSSDDYTRAYFADSTVKGKIAGKETDDDGTVITIAARFGDTSTRYRLDDNYLNRSGDVPKVGMQVTAKLDIYGRIAYMDIEESDMMYGYLVNYGNKGAISSTLQLKIFVEDGKMRVLDCNEKVIVDGKTEKGDDIVTAIERGKEDVTDISKGQLIRFSVDDDEKVREIDTLYQGAGGNDKLIRTHEPISRRYSSRSVRFGTTALIGSETVLFGIPEADDITLADEDDFSVFTTSFFTNNTSYTVETYKTDIEAGFESALVYQGSMIENITTSTDMFIISSIRYERDEYDDFVETVYGCSAGTMLTYRTSSDFSFTESGYESGDIVRLSLNVKGEVESVVCVYKYMDGIDPNTNAWINLPDGEAPSANFWEDGRFKTISSANAWSGFTVSYANVVSTKDNVLKLSRTGYTLADVDEVFKLSSTPVIVVYDKSVSRDKVYVGNFTDLIPGVNAGDAASQVFVRTEESNVRWIIVYK